MGNSIINWIGQWLNDRRQRVVVDGEVSSWKPVLSGVPQGSVLGPILFVIYINDLEEGVTGNILKFADDTKLFRKTKRIGDKQKLQDDIDKLVRWSEKWQMLFNFGKCKCLHTGLGNTGMNYEMGGTIIGKTVKEKDSGVSMNANMKVSEQCRIAASKGNQVLGMSLLQLVAELSARWQHQIVSHYLHGFKNYEFWKRGTRFVTLKSHCAI